MASLAQREGHTPALAPHPPHFFKIILPETLLQEKLKIPRKFVRKHGNTLLDSVLLEVPSGRVWQIDLTRYDNSEVWLENGWKPFVEYYSLSPGHLVAFRYEGSSKFSVFMYDVGSSEINYQPHNVCGEELNTQKTEEGDKDAISVENLDDSDLQTLPQKRKRINSATETSIGAEQKKTMDLKMVKSENDAYDSPCEERDIEGTQRATNLQKAKLAELLDSDSSYMVSEDDSAYQLPDSFCSSRSPSVDASQQPPEMSAASVVGKNWTKDEDCRLIACWLDQPFDSNQERDKRTPKQFKDHWSYSNSRVKKFHEYWEQVDTDEQSDDQVTANAVKMYAENERPSNFIWKHWWDLVRREPKWTSKYGFQCRSKRTRLDETGSYNLSQRNESSDQGQIQPTTTPLTEVRPQEQKMEERKEKEPVTESGTECTVEKNEELTPMKKLEMVRMKTKLIEKLDELEDMDESTMTEEQLERHKRKIKRYEDVLADTFN